MPLPEFSSNSLYEEPPKIHPSLAPILDTAGAPLAELTMENFHLIWGCKLCSWLVHIPHEQWAPHRERRWNKPIAAPQAEQVLLFSLLSDSRRASPQPGGIWELWAEQSCTTNCTKGWEPQQEEPIQGPAALQAKMLIWLPGINDNLFPSVQTHSLMGQLLLFTRNVFGREEWLGLEIEILNSKIFIPDVSVFNLHSCFKTCEFYLSKFLRLCWNGGKKRKSVKEQATENI